MSFNFPEEINNLDCSLRQKVVATFLYDEGIELDLTKTTRDVHSILFKAAGSDHYSAHIYPNGYVYIFSDHTAPFESNQTSFSKTLKMIYPDNWRRVKSEIDKLEPEYTQEGKPKDKKDVITRYRITVTDESYPPPECIAIVSAFMTCKSDSPKLMEWDDFVGWIKSPPKAWLRVKESKDFDTVKKQDTPAIVHYENEEVTIGWLDIDGKQHLKIDLEQLIERIKTDERVMCVFKTISGRGYAVGVGIRYSDKVMYERIMHRIIRDFEKKYEGLTIDRTCARYTQKRGFSYDPNIFVKESAHYYEGKLTMAKCVQKPEKSAAQSAIDTNSQIGAMLNNITQKAAMTDEAVATNMLDFLENLCAHLQIDIKEDKWTGRKTYKMGGQIYKDDTALYLRILAELKSTEGAIYNLHKTEICDFLQTRTDIVDKVMEPVLGGKWDGVDRWPQLQSALHLDDWDLHFFQLWFRQGVALLHNDGGANDVQRNFMLILYSREQHIGKTELVKKISCGTGSFTQKSLNTNSKDSMMEIYSNWIYEYGELGSQFRKADINTLKSFITDSSVVYRRPYDREPTQYPVRTSIIGTTNEEDLFIDPSGNRRYLIINCRWGRADWPEINKIDFIQIWRQARKEWLNKMPITLSIEDQQYNESRCFNKRVITTEMYAILDVFSMVQKSGYKGVYRIEEGAGVVIVNMLGLLKQLKDSWRDVKQYNLTREMEAMGFKRDRNRLGDAFTLPIDKFEQLLDIRSKRVK